MVQRAPITLIAIALLFAAVKGAVCQVPSATKDRNRPTITVSMASNVCHAAAPVKSAHPSTAVFKHAPKIATAV